MYAIYLTANCLFLPALVGYHATKHGHMQYRATFYLCSSAHFSKHSVQDIITGLCILNKGQHSVYTSYDDNMCMQNLDPF